MSDLADLENKFQFGTAAKFDFDIRNYNTRDMMNILNIAGDPSNLNYYNVKGKTNQVIEKLREDENLSSEMKNKFESFLRAMEFFLIYKYNVKAENYVLDKTTLDPSKLLANVKVTKQGESKGYGGGGGGITEDGQTGVSINTYRRRIVKRQLSFDTKFRPNYFKSSPSNFKMVLATPLKNVVSMRLVSLEFPNVVYDIDNALGTNEFAVIYRSSTNESFGGIDSTSPGNLGEDYAKSKYNIVDLDDGGYKITYKIPSGNYQSNMIVAALNNFNTLDGLNFSIDIKTGRTVISYDLSGSELTETVGPTFDLDFTNTIEPTIPITKNLGWKLGFRQLKYSGSTTYISEAPADLGGQKVLFFCVDDYRTNVTENVSIVYEKSFMNRNILARIPLRQGKFVVIYDNGSDNIRKSREYFGPVTIDKLHFRLLDEYGMDIRQGYSDYSFGLEFDILYEN